MLLCKHQPYTVVDWVREPKYSTNEILLSKPRIDAAQEHLIVKFSACPSRPDWFYLSRKVVRRHKTQKNGAGEVYVVSLDKSEPFNKQDKCEHAL
jgi:hypothetical protein